MRAKTEEDRKWCEYANLIIARNKLLEKANWDAAEVAILDAKIKELESELDG